MAEDKQSNITTKVTKIMETQQSVTIIKKKCGPRMAENKQSTITNEVPKIVEAKQSVTVIKKKCGICVNCMKNNCRNCVYCKDMKKYGGSGKLKQSCSAKKCSLLVSTSKVKSMPKQIKKGILATSSSSLVLDHGVKLTPKKKVSFLSPVAIMQPHSFEMEVVQFLRDCVFEEMTSSEIEAVTFRKVKELWIEKKDSELSGEERGYSEIHLNSVLKKTAAAKPLFATIIVARPSELAKCQDIFFDSLFTISIRLI